MASGILCMAVLVLLLASGAASSVLARPYYGRYDYDYDYDYAYRPPARYMYRRPFYANPLRSGYRYPYSGLPYIPADYPSYYGRYGGLRDYDYSPYSGYGTYGGYDGYGGYGLYRGYGGYYY